MQKPTGADSSCRSKPQTLFKKTSSKNLEAAKNSGKLEFADIPKREADEGQAET